MENLKQILNEKSLSDASTTTGEQPTVLLDFLEVVIATFQTLSENLGVHLSLDYQLEKNWALLLDRQEFLKIIHLLLMDVLKLAPAGSSVELLVTRKEDKVMFQVCNADLVIHPDELSQIFNLEYQLTCLTTKSGEGVGIGFPLSKMLSGAMGGDFWVESSTVVGGTFTLTIPARECAFETADRIKRPDDLVDLNANLTSSTADLYVQIKRVAQVVEKGVHSTSGNNQAPQNRPHSHTDVRSMESSAEASIDVTDKWVQQLHEITRANLGDARFNVDHLAKLMGIGRTAIYNLVRQKTGMSANQFIQKMRLSQAHELLESKQYSTLHQVADVVGFRSSDYFSRLYREHYGKSPVTYL